MVRKSHKQTKTEDNLFTGDQVTEAVRDTKPSNALGPDEIAPIMLKHMGPNAVSYLTNLLNMTMKTQVIPNATCGR